MTDKTTTFETPGGTRYVKDPGVYLIAHPTMLWMPKPLLDLDEAFQAGYEDYTRAISQAGRSDGPGIESTTHHPLHGALLSQFAGQLCYLAFSDGRTPCSQNREYLDRIKQEGHGSVMEHANYTLLFTGIDRACTHELVRHRAGMAYSQVSQRFVSGKLLRFVEPWEDQQDPELHTTFEQDIDINKAQYDLRAVLLKKVFPQREGESKTDYRKRRNSSARSVLGNYVEAPILVTANARAWRHVISMRTSPKADVRIRRPMLGALSLLQAWGGALFSDFVREPLPDGTDCTKTAYPKV